MMNDEIGTVGLSSEMQLLLIWSQPCSHWTIIKFLILGLHSFHHHYYVLNLNYLDSSFSCKYCSYLLAIIVTASVSNLDQIC